MELFGVLGIGSENAESILTYSENTRKVFQGSLTLDFRFQVFFMNLCPPGPQVFHWSRSEFFRKFADIFANYCLTPVINCSAVSLTPAINLCHGFSVIAGVVDTGEQFITGDNDTGNNFVAGDNDTGEQL
jgi:hypothetical protein